MDAFTVSLPVHCFSWPLSELLHFTLGLRVRDHRTLCFPPPRVVVVISPPFAPFGGQIALLSPAAPSPPLTLPGLRLALSDMSSPYF